MIAQIIAQIDSTQIIAAGVSPTAYSVLFLIGVSLIGIITHVLSDIAKSQQNKTFISLHEYFSATWGAIALSFFICLAAIMIRHELMNIPDFSKWEGIAMFSTGFMGRSVLIPILNFLSTKFGIKETTNG